MVPRSVTVILPAPYRGGTLRVTKTVARMLVKGSRDAGEPCHVRIAVLANNYDLKTEFRDAIDEGIEIREISFQEVSSGQVKNTNSFQGRDVALPFQSYFMPEDGINNCIDSDVWLMVSDRMERPLAPVRPLVVFATDYIQRYVPSIFWPPRPGEVDLSYIQTVRQADAVFVTTPQTGLDVVSYVGVPKKRVHLAPMDFDPTSIARVDRARSRPDASQPYFIWPTNTTRHKNHKRAFEALAMYYEELGGRCDVKLVGPYSEWLNPERDFREIYGSDDHVDAVRAFIRKTPSFKGKVHFLGELSDSAYASSVAGAAFLWHPTLTDNGTFVVAEAAFLGCPSLMSGYPQMRYIAERFSIPDVFFDATNVREMAEALKDMEVRYDEIRRQLPTSEDLNKHSWHAYAQEYWTLLKGALA